ncbi:MAG: ATP synthase F1 subunit delta, partial [Planctomycetota bacterium]
LPAVLSNPRVQTAARKSILMAAGLDTASDLLQDFVKLCLDHRRPEVIAEAPEEYLRLDREVRGVVLATVQTSGPMGADLRTSVQAKLEEVTGKTIELIEETDPELIGGVRVLIGSRMYDGSLKRRLDDLSAHLQSTRVH